MDAAPAVPGPVDTALQHELVRERGYLLRLARRQLRDGAQAEDVVHDTLLAALQSAGRFKARSSVRTWLTAILHHRIADAWRRDYRQPGPAAVERQPDEADSADSLASAAIDEHDPPRLLEGRQSVLLLADGLQQLSPLAAQVLMLRQLEGLSNDETAARLQLDPRRVATVLHRARAQLRRRLQMKHRPRPLAMAA